MGDCRCVICRNNIAIPLTKDHKPNWPEENHRISKLGGTIEFDKVDWRIGDLSVSRAFGDVEHYPYVIHYPDIFTYEIIEKDKFIVLACDGLWDVLSNQDVVNYILMECYDNTLTTRINHSVNIAKKLADYAIKKKSTDNITVVVIFLTHDINNL